MLLSWLLNVAYVILLTLASPWLVWAAIRKGKYREGFAEKFFGRVPIRMGDRPCVWLHAVSVGEVNLLGTLIDEFNRQRKDLQFVISTTTMTGMAVAKSRYAEHTVFYCPLDFSWAVNAALDRVRPNLLVLAELELWPNLISLTKRRGIDISVVNGRLSENSYRGYRRVRPIVRRLLEKLALIAVQSETYAERFRQLSADPPSVHVTGSMKFDGAETDRGNFATKQLKQLADITPEHVVFLAGSTQKPEEHYAITTFRQLHRDHPQLRLILVPRHPERFDAVAKLLDDSGLPWQRRSAIDPHRNWSVLLVDRMGELRDWWGAAQIGFVGGSFGEREGQNMIEPAAYGVVTAVGPRTRNFRDVMTLLTAANAITVVHHQMELITFVRRAIENPTAAAEQAEHARQVVLSQLGATKRTVDLLLPLLRETQKRQGSTER